MRIIAEKLPKFLLLALAAIGLSILPRLVAQTSDATEENVVETKPSEIETDPPIEQKLHLKSQPAAPRSLAIPVTQEPLEFAKQPRGYALSQLEVRDLAISPNGQMLAAAYGRWNTIGELVVYEFSTKKIIKKFPFPKGVASVVFSIDGKYLAAPIWDDVIQVWDTATWELVARKNTEAKVSRLAFSPNGKYLASGSEGGQLRLFTVGKWEEQRDITGDTFRFWKIAFSPDSKLIAAVGGSIDQSRFGRGLIFNVQTGKQIAKVETAGTVIASAAFSPDGKELAIGEFTTGISFWEPTTGKVISALRNVGTADTLEYTGDGLLIAPSHNGDVHIIKDRTVQKSFTRHEGQCFAARLSPDGKTLVSGGIDTVIRFWNPETRVSTGTLRPHDVPEDMPEAVLAIAHSPDGQHVVTTHEDGSVRLRDAKEGTFIKRLEGHEDVVAAVAFSFDGKTLATGSYDQHVKLWSVRTGKVLKDLKGHTNWVFAVAFSPDGKTLASSGYDKTIRLWNAETGESLGVLEGHTAAVRTLAFSPNGEQLVSAGSDRNLKLWDLKTQKTIYEMNGHTAAVRAVAFAPSGKKIASAGEDQSIRFWNPETGQLVQELKGHTGMVWALAFSPRGRTLASGGFDNTLRLWNGETGAALQTLTGHQDVVTSLAYAPDTSSLITGSYDKTLKRWPAVDPPVPALADLNIGDNSTTSPARFAVFSPDGTRLMTGIQDRKLQLWNLETGRVIKTAQNPAGIAHGAYSPDGKWLAVGGFGKQSFLWNAETLELVATLDSGRDQNIIVAFSPDGKWLATGSRDGFATIWNVETHEKVRELPQQAMPVLGMVFSPDGSLLATATGDAKNYQQAGTVKLWSTKTWEEIANLDGPKRKMRRVQFSPNGKMLVAGGSQQDLLVYDVPGRKLVKQIPIGPEISSVAFLPDSQRVILGAFNGIVGLWNLETGNRIIHYDGHRASKENSRYVLEVAVSPDGTVVASAGTDGHVKLWPTTSRARVWSAPSSP